MPALFIVVRLILASVLFRIVMSIITAFGLGIYSYNKISNFFDQIKEYAMSGYNQLPATALSLLDIGGFTTGLEIMLSGMAFTASFLAARWGFGLFLK